MPESRPRIGYNEQGVCNACVWSEEKQGVIDWSARWRELEEICERHKSRNPKFLDVICPVSGGKDSSYVAYMLKHRMGMHPLCITLKPPLSLPLGIKNLETFIEHGYDHVHITPNHDVGREIAKTSFIERGQPLMAWIMSVQTAIFKCAVLFDIPFVMFGEEGESEYGGSSKLKHKPTYDLDDSIKMYLSGNDPSRFLDRFSEKDLYWWTYPTEQSFRALESEIAHWSYFENWDSYAHYLVAKEKCGLEEEEVRCLGTYNNFAQTDTSLYDLHCYLMYLKFGFGRCTQDVGIDIRRGAITRKQALALVRRYDGEYPEPYIADYLGYFRMTQEEFDSVLDCWANKELFEKQNGRWTPTFEPE